MHSISKRVYYFLNKEFKGWQNNLFHEDVHNKNHFINHHRYSNNNGYMAYFCLKL